MACLWQSFQVDTTSVSLKSASISTLKAGSAPVTPLVLYGIVGGGDHFLSAVTKERTARLPYLLPLKKISNMVGKVEN